jgi:hypothetical protein
MAGFSSKKLCGLSETVDNIVGHGHIRAREVQSGQSYPCNDILLNNALAIEIR